VGLQQWFAATQPLFHISKIYMSHSGVPEWLMFFCGFNFRLFCYLNNTDFWIPKIERNIQRDREVNAALEAQGWQVVRVWEHELKQSFGAAVMRIVSVLEQAAGWAVFLEP
jgi:G:T-mismatch repair DNA endonuclease (very short patch repair protein)